MATAVLDYKQLYEEKCQEVDELIEQAQIYQGTNQLIAEQSTTIIGEFENEIKELRKKNEALNRQLTEVKEKRKSGMMALERELDHIKKQRNDFQTKFYEFQKKVVQLENNNETLESENRASKMMLAEYEHRVEKTMEELALLQTEMEENKSASQQQMTRLRSQLKQTEEELYVVHLKHQKHNDESENRRSRLSSNSFSSQDDATRLHTTKPAELGDNLANLGIISVTVDFKRNKDAPFQQTIKLVANLMGELDQRVTLLRRSKQSVIKGVA